MNWDRIIWGGILTLLLISLGRIFVKAGQNGWAALIPVYNLYILLKIVRQPWQWLVFMLVPLFNLVFLVRVHMELAKKFDRSAYFGLWLTLMPPIFYPLLAFSDAKYNKKA